MAIQEVQNQTRVRKNIEIYEEVKKWDAELGKHVELCFKIRDREVKKTIMEEISECKDKTVYIMEILRLNTGTISNVQIA